MSADMAINGPQKAALVLLALDEDVAAEIMRNFEGGDLRRIAESADTFQASHVEALDSAFEEFEKRMKDPILPHGAGAYLRRLAAHTFGLDRAQKLFAPPVEETQPIDAIRTARTATLAKLLEEEHAQVAAVIVSQLPREQASQVLIAMPPERQLDVISRIASLKEVPMEMVMMASEAMAKALAAAGGLKGSDEQRDFDGISFAAGLLNELPPTDSERLLGGLQEANAKIAPKVREAMFTFEDLKRLSTRSLQMLMREVASDQLLLAMKTASEELRDHFFKAVSSRAAAAMQEDLAAMPPSRLADVERAQREIVEFAIRMSSEGRLVLPGASEKFV